ncbi:hypothetical protein PHMEG_00037792 [Phytophthora megakarya]|uniref:Uncharacterized protein n=1 Tax=Phytophthora megakarya TaxID=4795 RepID=A0A225UIM9_9STRA|nr:hypothetical protein PHMEG_00037792 [Phytophthora megakarya]
MEVVEWMCDYRGASECDWKRAGSELQEAGLCLETKLSRRRRRGRAVRTVLRRLYLYWKYGSLGGDVPECINRQLQQLRPDNNVVSFIYADGSVSSSTLVIDLLRVYVARSLVSARQIASSASRSAGDRPLNTSW